MIGLVAVCVAIYRPMIGLVPARREVIEFTK